VAPDLICADGICSQHGFTWDRKKAALNLRKHRISFTEAATVFAAARGYAAGRNGRRAADSGGPVGERTRSDHGLLESPEDTIRIISARRATSHERKRYEEGGW